MKEGKQDQNEGEELKKNKMKGRIKKEIIRGVG
jgi:hypothetical protein